MSGKIERSENEGHRFERRRRNATPKRRITPPEADDIDAADIADGAFAEPTDEDLQAIEEEAEDGST
jgi:hypothetical protein